MRDLQLASCLILGSLLVGACEPGLIHDIGEVNTGGQTGILGTNPTGGLGALGTGGTTATGGAGSTGGAQPSGGTGPAFPSNEVTLFASWQFTMPPGGGPMGLIASIHNGTDHSIYVRGCVADWWRLENDIWVSKSNCHFGTDNSELQPGQNYYAPGSIDIWNIGAGIYRLQGTYSVGCGLGGNCTASGEIDSEPVWVALVANQTAPNTVGPDGLHATCPNDAPCPAGQTAIDLYGGGNSCTCEIPCDSAQPNCPSGTVCTFASDQLGSLCQ